MAEHAAATEAKGSPHHNDSSAEEGAHAPQHQVGKIPLHRVALHHHRGAGAEANGGSSNGTPYVVPMDMYRENRAKLCARLRAKVCVGHCFQFTWWAVRFDLDWMESMRGGDSHARGACPPRRMGPDQTHSHACSLVLGG